MRAYVICAIFLVLAVPGIVTAAQTEDETSHPVKPVQEEILENELPETHSRSQLVFSLKPNASDAVKEDFIRVPLTIRYGITDNLEAFLQPVTYFDNFFRGQYGLYMSDYVLGTKYNFGQVMDSGVVMAFSFKMAQPVRDDIRVSDGFNHNIPAIHLSRDFRGYRQMVVGLTLSENIVTGYGSEGSISKPNDTITISAGVNYRPDNINYSIESMYTTDEPFDGEAETANIAAVLSLNINDWLDEIPGVWTLGFGMRYWFLDSDRGVEFIGRMKLNLKLNYKVDLANMKRNRSD